MLESWEEAAKNLIAHFRAVCRGHIPLNMVWTKAEQDAAELDNCSLDFITRLNGMAQSRGMTARYESQASANQPYQLKVSTKYQGPL